jgi:NADP-dependent 3-hydroxy acid dehydrogenase YdfG
VNPFGIKVTLIEPGAVGTDMQSEYSPEEQRQKIEKLEMLRAEDIAACVLYTITQPKRCDVVELQIRPHLQAI